MRSSMTPPWHARSTGSTDGLRLGAATGRTAGGGGQGVAVAEAHRRQGVAAPGGEEASGEGVARTGGIELGAGKRLAGPPRGGRARPPGRLARGPPPPDPPAAG